jgi:hypothetical protein
MGTNVHEKDYWGEKLGKTVFEDGPALNDALIMAEKRIIKEKADDQKKYNEHMKSPASKLPSPKKPSPVLNRGLGQKFNRSTFEIESKPPSKPPSKSSWFSFGRKRGGMKSRSRKPKRRTYRKRRFN